MYKRGLAPVLSIALITLGVVVAVSLLWVFASDTIKTKNKPIDPGCFTADLSVVSCQTYGSCSYDVGNGIYTADVLVKRNTGKAEITGIRFSFEDSIGKKGVYDAQLTTLSPGYTLEELQSLRFNNYPARVPSSGPDNLVRVIPLIGSDFEVCPIASQPLRCTPTGNPPPPLGNVPGQNDISGLCCQCPRNESECYNGNDPRYPIINGLVNYDSDVVIDVNGIVTNGPNPSSPYSYGTPPGNLTVCCGTVPQAYTSGIDFGGVNYPPGSSCPYLVNS